MIRNNILIACVSNNVDLLASNLSISPDVLSGRVRLLVKKDFSSASIAFNQVVEESEEDVIVFVHQDVYLPAGWVTRLAGFIESLALKNIEWGVLGVAGVSRKEGFVGHLWSTGLSNVLGGKFKGFVEVETVDEVVIVVNKKKGLSFDSNMPGFHLFGTDICLTSASIDLKNYVIDCPIVHNSKPVKYLNKDYFACYKFICSKWRDSLPIKTCVIEINGNLINIYVKNLKLFKKTLLSKNNPLNFNPASKSSDLGFENYR